MTTSRRSSPPPDRRSPRAAGRGGGAPTRRPAAGRRASGGAPRGGTGASTGGRRRGAKPAPAAVRGRHAAPRGPGRLRRLTAGNRPYALGLLVWSLLLSGLVLGPLQSMSAAADRVDALEAGRDKLQREVDRLEELRLQLNDPEEIELLARRDLGLVKPGEIPYVVMAPEPEVDHIGPEAQEEPADLPWYRRLLQLLGDLVG